MEKIHEIKELLHKIQRTNAGQRAEVITIVQNMIWDESNEFSDEMQQVLSDLAGDLNLYEDDIGDRDEKLGYYGEPGLTQVINTALKKIDGNENDNVSSQKIWLLKIPATRITTTIEKVNFHRMSILLSPERFYLLKTK